MFHLKTTKIKGPDRPFSRKARGFVSLNRRFLNLKRLRKFGFAGGLTDENGMTRKPAGHTVRYKPAPAIQSILIVSPMLYQPKYKRIMVHEASVFRSTADSAGIKPAFVAVHLQSPL